MSAVTDLTTTVRAGVQEISAICTGLDLTEEDSEHGQYRTTNAIVRLLASAEDPANALDIGRVIEVKHTSTDEWVSCRIDARKDTSGIIMLNVNTEYE